MTDALARVVDEIAAAPQTAAALTLYALFATLEQERSGCLFKLDKLRDLSPAQRAMAYALIEWMLERGTADAEWRSARSRIDALVRNG